MLPVYAGGRRAAPLLASPQDDGHSLIGESGASQSLCQRPSVNFDSRTLWNSYTIWNGYDLGGERVVRRHRGRL